MALTETVHAVFVATMTKFISNHYEALEETLTHMKCLKLKNCSGEKVTYLFNAILVDTERLESSGIFKPEHLGYITCIIADNYDSRLRLWFILNYK